MRHVWMSLDQWIHCQPEMSGGEVKGSLSSVTGQSLGVRARGNCPLRPYVANPVAPFEVPY